MGNFGNSNDFGRDVTRRRPVSNALPNEFDEIVGEVVVGMHAHKKHDTLIALPILADSDRFEDLRYGFHLTVDFRRPDPDSTGIQGGVGATCDDEAARWSFFGEVAVGPNAREPFEVGGPVTLFVSVVPKTQRH